MMIALVGLPQGLLHMQYREGVAAAVLRRWTARYLAGLSAVAGLMILLLAFAPVLAPLPHRQAIMVLLSAAVLAAAHQLWRSLTLRGASAVAYAALTAAPALLILVALIPFLLFGWHSGFEWALLAAASVAAIAAGWLSRRAAPGRGRGDSTWSRRRLWSVSLETGVQSVLTSLSPAMQLSLIVPLGASLAQVGIVSLGLQVYQLFGVAAVYVAPLLYDRAARRLEVPSAVDLVRHVRERVPPGWRALLGVAIGTGLLGPWLVPLTSPAVAAMLSLMTLAGLLALAVRLLSTLQQARGEFRALSLQALARVIIGSSLTGGLMAVCPATVAVPLAMLVVEATLLFWLLKRDATRMRCAEMLRRHEPSVGASFVLVCSNYPFTGRAGEVTFVAPEVARLARVLGRVCVAPQHAHGPALPLPAGVELDLGLALALRRARSPANYVRALGWPGFWGEVARALDHGGLSGCARVWRWAAFAQATWEWARRRSDTGPVLFATYWRGGSTLALARLAASRPQTAAVSRVHGHELYADRWRPPFQPWISVYAGLTLVVPISRHGLDYLLSAGVPPEQLWMSRLGTEASPPARASSDGVVRVVSCSAMLPLKRVPLIARALGELARSLPVLRLNWTHFGDGADRAEVDAILLASPANLKAALPGQVDNGVVLRHYAEQPVDLFLLLSESEGLPVVLQEACAAGIPVLATDVGGVAEIVGAENGMLLPATPTVGEVAAAVRGLCVDANPAALAQKRAGARARWAADFDAERNHLRFAHRMCELMQSLDEGRDET